MASGRDLRFAAADNRRPPYSGGRRLSGTGRLIWINPSNLTIEDRS